MQSKFRKKTIKALAIALALTLVLPVLYACAASAPAPAAMPQAAAATAAPAAMEPTGETGYGGFMEMDVEREMAAEAPAAMPSPVSGGNPLAQHKIIRNASIMIETDDFDGNLNHIETKIASIGGYIEHSYLSGKKPEDWESSGRTVQITARVPQEQFEPFIQDVEGSGKVTSLERGSSDVTMEYYDNESRISTLKIQLARLEDILTKSEKLADVLALETEIARIRYEIESLTTTQRRYDDLVQFSTVHVTVFEVKNVTYAPPAQDLGSRISNAFVSVVNGLVTFFEWLIVILIGAFPLLVIAGLVLFIVLFVRKKRMKKRAMQRQQSTPQAPENRRDKGPDA